MEVNQTLFSLVSRSLLRFEKLLRKTSPDIVLVQGDTATSFVASLAAYFNKIPIGHIEAGLRTYDKFNPFPEEANRHLISVLADIHFAPTRGAYNNLIQEKISKKKVFITGNTVIDALFLVTQKNNSIKHLKDRKMALLFNKINFNKRIILVTAHRRENFGKDFENICFAIKDLALKNNSIEIVYPVHLNPNVQLPVQKLLGNIAGIHLIPPLGYEPFIYLMKESFMVLTDSGGIQEEAPALGKPVLVMRKITERPEAVTAGTVKLVGTDKHCIVRQAQRLLDNSSEYKKMSKAINPYGDGKASQRIVKCLLGIPFKEFKSKKRV